MDRETENAAVSGHEPSGAGASGGDAGTAGMDPSLADAAANTPGGVAERGLDLLQAGGPVVAILLAMSVIALAIILLKLWQFAQLRIGERKRPAEALRLWRAGHAAEAQELADRCRGPVGQVMARAIRGERRGLPEAQVREEVVRYGGEILEDLRSWFRPLEVIASLSPLLGLFGTVLGMISAFRQLEAAGNQVNPAILSGGIWVALLTTAVGLAVAIPVVAVLNWLERRVDRLAHEMESIVTQVFTVDLSREAAGETAPHLSHDTARIRPAAAAGE